MEINLRPGGIEALHIEDLEGIDAGPIDIFRAVRSAPGNALLLSGGGLDASKYSIIGLDPFLIITARGDQVDIVDRGEAISLKGDPFEALREILRAFRVDDGHDDWPLTSGGIGYLGYELGRHIEQLPCTAVDDQGLPDLHFAFYRTLLLHEHRTGRTRAASLQVAGDPLGASAQQNIDDVRAAILDAPGMDPAEAPFVCRPPVSNFTREAYLESVSRIIRYIIDGDIYQANLSQRFSTEYGGDPYDLFCRLFRINPAPFFAYLDPGDFQVISSSPERFLNVSGSRVETRPIKGTAPRVSDPATDRQTAEGLLASEKDSAELSMIVDLLRNDLGKVCRFGSVEVGEHKRLEAYTNVHHLVSIVTGELRPEMDRIDLIRAAFPGGSITGCPKIRSMEIIDALEPNTRGVYTGAIGYIGFDGSMDLNIAIRTSILKESRLTFNVGGGIVYDSSPESEYEETLHKAASIMEAISGGGVR